MFKKVLCYLPLNVTVLYYNAFIRSFFSYCLLYWFNNDRSGRHKLITKINNLISLLARYHCLNVESFCSKFVALNLLNVHKLQSLSLMYDIFNNKLFLSHFPKLLNNEVHGHFTRSYINYRITHISCLDKRKFVYYSILNWNNTPVVFSFFCLRILLWNVVRICLLFDIHFFFNTGLK